MKNKINIGLLIIINAFALMGIYGLFTNLACDDVRNCFWPNFAPNILFYAMIYGLPIAAAYMLLQKRQINKFIGVVYFIAFLGILYLIDQALV